MNYLNYLLEDSCDGTKVIADTIYRRALVTPKKGLALIADTGAGKTTLCFYILNKLHKMGYNVALAVPFRTLALNKELVANNEGFAVDFGKKVASFHGKPVLTTYDSFAAHLNDYDYVVVDEPQVMLEQAPIRGNAIAELLRGNAKMIFTTSTPYLFDTMFDLEVIKFERIDHVNDRTIEIYQTNKDTSSIIEYINSNHSKDYTEFIRINNKAEINLIAEVLIAAGNTVAVSYSEEDNILAEVNKDYISKGYSIEDIKRGIFLNADYVLHTSVLDNGADVDVNRRIIMHALGNRTKTKHEVKRQNIHPNNAKQLVGRVRRATLKELGQDEVILRLYGNYGMLNAFDTSLAGTYDSHLLFKKENHVLEEFNTLYKYPEEFNQVDYTQMLKELWLNVIDKGELIMANAKRFKAVRHSTVLKYLNQSKSYNKLHTTPEDLKGTHFNMDGSEVDNYFTLELPDSFDTDYFLRPSERVLAEQIIQSLHDAKKLGISANGFLFNTTKTRYDSFTKIVEACKYAKKGTGRLGEALNKAFKEGQMSMETYQSFQSEQDLIRALFVEYFNVPKRKFSNSTLKNIKLGNYSENMPICIQDILGKLKYLESKLNQSRAIVKVHTEALEEQRKISSSQQHINFNNTNVSNSLKTLSNSFEITFSEEQLNYIEATTEHTSTDDYKSERNRLKLLQIENELLDNRIIMSDEVFRTRNQHLRHKSNYLNY